jgi:putative transposase
MPFWKLFYHVVWSTKSREPLIDAATEQIVARSIRTTIAEMSGISFAIGFMPDHVHTAVSVPPSVTISDVVKRMKGASARAVNQATSAHSFGWQPEYGVLSFGEKNLPDVIDYIENQKTRHSEKCVWPLLERIDAESSRLPADLLP